MKILSALLLVSWLSLAASYAQADEGNHFTPPNPAPVPSPVASPTPAPVNEGNLPVGVNRQLRPLPSIPAPAATVPLPPTLDPALSWFPVAVQYYITPQVAYYYIPNWSGAPVICAGGIWAQSRAYPYGFTLPFATGVIYPGTYNYVTLVAPWAYYGDYFLSYPVIETWCRY